MIMTASECVRCGRPTPDGYADTGCGVDRPRAQLAEIIDLTPAARDVARRQARRGTGGGASGKPGSTLPIDLGATAKLDGVQNVLTTWVRAITEERGPAAEINAGAIWGASEGARTGRTGRDDLSGSATWLVGHLEWMRHKPWVDEFLADVEAAARVIRSVVRGPAERRYLGPCGATLCWRCDHEPEDPPCTATCEGDVYGLPGGDKGTCRTCGAQVAQDERKAWLDDVVRQYTYTASEIASAYPIKRNTINQWASRNRLIAHGSNEQGRPRYNLGDVLELAAEDAARREEQRAAREQRDGTMAR